MHTYIQVNHVYEHARCLDADKGMPIPHRATPAACHIRSVPHPQHAPATAL